MARRGLGRGLEALIPQAEEGGDQILSIEIERIDPNPWQPRRRHDEAGLEELAASIREHGVVQPIIVCRGEEGRYRLVAGERRWRACKMLGLGTIPAIVKELSDREITEVALVENIQREDLNPLEEATAYRILLEEFGLTQEEVARRVGKTRAQISNTVRLLHLPERVRELIGEGLLSAGHGRALLGLEDAAEQVSLAEEIVRRGLSVREAEELVRRRSGGRSAARPREGKQSEEWEEVARQLAERLGTRVRIRAKDGRGRIEIEFYGWEDLERLLELMGVEFSVSRVTSP